MLILEVGAFGCGVQNPRSVFKQLGPAASSASTEQTYVGSYLNPEVFAGLSVATDDSGRYVQIDDMRFRVSLKKSFGYLGALWPNGTLSYQLDPQVKSDAYKASQFASACRLLTATTGVGCIDRDVGGILPSDYVYVVNDNVNKSYVGRVGGRQLLLLVSWDNQIIIAHEIMHALGWIHEQSRPDRDHYVIIHYENIIPGEEHNFDIVPSASKGSPYNFDSIMHYGPYAFSSNVRMTIEPEPPFQSHLGEMGQTTHISPGDVTEIIGFYGRVGTEWCGVTRAPSKVPAGCFLECTTYSPDYSIGRWWICGRCRGAERCP